MAVAMVLAVYMPPQAPAPGQACLMMPLNSSGLMLPLVFLPQASKAETMSRDCPSYFPAAMVPP